MYRYMVAATADVLTISASDSTHSALFGDELDANPAGAVTAC
jgi:hypothetical protein